MPPLALQYQDAPSQQEAEQPMCTALSKGHWTGFPGFRALFQPELQVLSRGLRTGEWPLVQPEGPGSVCALNHGNTRLSGPSLHLQG